MKKLEKLKTISLIQDFPLYIVTKEEYNNLIEGNTIVDSENNNVSFDENTIYFVEGRGIFIGNISIIDNDYYDTIIQDALWKKDYNIPFGVPQLNKNDLISLNQIEEQTEWTVYSGNVNDSTNIFVNFEVKKAGKFILNIQEIKLIPNDILETKSYLVNCDLFFNPKSMHGNFSLLNNSYTFTNEEKYVKENISTEYIYNLPEGSDKHIFDNMLFNATSQSRDFDIYMAGVELKYKLLEAEDME